MALQAVAQSPTGANAHSYPPIDTFEHAERSQDDRKQSNDKVP